VLETRVKEAFRTYEFSARIEFVER